jgi:hypothetical protein
MQSGRKRFVSTIQFNDSTGGAFGEMAIPNNLVAFGISEQCKLQYDPTMCKTPKMLEPQAANKIMSLVVDLIHCKLDKSRKVEEQTNKRRLHGSHQVHHHNAP